jgi:hypothetical protein
MDAKLSKEGPAQDIGVESTIGAERYITGLQLHVITLGYVFGTRFSEVQSTN